MSTGGMVLTGKRPKYSTCATYRPQISEALRWVQPGPPRWEAGDRPVVSWHGLLWEAGDRPVVSWHGNRSLIARMSSVHDVSNNKQRAEIFGVANCTVIWAAFCCTWPAWLRDCDWPVKSRELHVTLWNEAKWRFRKSIKVWCYLYSYYRLSFTFKSLN